MLVVQVILLWCKIKPTDCTNINHWYFASLRLVILWYKTKHAHQSLITDL
jgi:hypothetical protein